MSKIVHEVAPGMYLNEEEMLELNKAVLKEHIKTAAFSAGIAFLGGIAVGIIATLSNKDETEESEEN